MSGQAAAHPIWSCDSDAIKREYQHALDGAKKWERLCGRLDSEGERLQVRVEALEAQRDTLRSAIKQHRNATESRLKLLASSARVPESSDLMLAPDRALYAVLDETTPEERS